MSNREFMERLEYCLRGKLSPEDLEDVMNYHREYFAEAGEGASAELDTPEVVAERILTEHDYYEPPRRKLPRWAIALMVTAAFAVGLCGSIAGVRALILWKGLNLVQTVEWATPVDQVTIWDRVEPVDVVPGLTEREGGILDAAAGTFQTIEIDVDVGNVTIERSGHAFSCSVTGGEAGGLSYRTDPEEGALRITGTGAKGSEVDDIYIIVPEDDIMRKVSVRTGVGDVFFADIQAEEVDLNTGTGDITVSGSVYTALDCETGTGDISVNGAFCCDVELETGIGVVVAELADCSPGEYDISCEGGLGELWVNGVQKGRSYKSSGGPYELEISCGVGDISLNFRYQ